MRFTTSDLQEAGFVGWLKFADLRATSPCPITGGVYVVTYGGGDPGSYAPKSCGGWFKGKDPSVPNDALAANWVPGAEAVYIGKSKNLNRRLREFADFGAGRPIGHWGGRLIWQLPSLADLRVAWKETPDRVPVEAETDLIRLFRDTYGKPPFANAPHLRGR